MSGYTARPPEARLKPKVSAFINARFDKIEALAPDLILAFSDLQADIAAELTRRGYPVFTFNQRSVSEILQTIRILGGIVGCQPRAEALARELESGLDAVRASAARFPRRPRVFFEEWDDPLISGIRWVDELLELAGGEPVLARASSGGARQGADRHPGGGRGPGSGGRVRLVVRQGRTQAHHSRTRGLGGGDGGRPAARLRGQVDLHPATGSGRAHRGRSPAARAARPNPRPRCRRLDRARKADRRRREHSLAGFG